MSGEPTPLPSSLRDPALHIVEPTAEPVPERRRYARQACAIRAQLEIPSWKGAQRIDSLVQDASVKGLRMVLSGDYVIKQGDPVTVRWRVPLNLSQTAVADEYPVDGIVTRFYKRADGRHVCSVRFERLVSEVVQDRQAKVERMVIASLMLLVAGVIVLLKSRNVMSFWYQPLLQAYSLATAFFILSRVGLSMFYREPRDRGYMPSVSLIVAVKNEEAHIATTVRHCFESRYPEDLLEVIVIDDGSTDKTWDVLKRLQTQFPHMRSFRFETNKGKRHAMALGAQAAAGDFLIYIDSDSWLDPEGIYRIVQPFHDPKVGAVAGHTLVHYEVDNFISKMEAVRYFVSQRVMKAAESIFQSVTCCPGPFSAYRRDAVMPILDAWLGQTFLGTEATFGDDRSLTNFLLRNYRVVYHAGARCSTYVPNAWAVFFRQQLRWKKSWIRETTIAMRFMFRKHPVAAISYYVGVLITLFSPFVALRALVVLPVTLGSLTFVPYLLGLILVYVFFGLTYQYHTRSRRWIHGLAFAFLYVFFLSFQNYYAMLTVRRNHWGTR